MFVLVVRQFEHKLMKRGIDLLHPVTKRAVLRYPPKFAYLADGSHKQLNVSEDEWGLVRRLFTLDTLQKYGKSTAFTKEIQIRDKIARCREIGRPRPGTIFISF